MGTIVVTGSGSGIGAATAARLRADGHTVIGVDLRGAEIEADGAVEFFRERGREAVSHERAVEDGRAVRWP